MQVNVVTRRDLGWDNIVGVFDPAEVSLNQLREKFSDGPYTIFTKYVETNFDWYDRAPR